MLTQKSPTGKIKYGLLPFILLTPLPAGKSKEPAAAASKRTGGTGGLTRGSRRPASSSSSSSDEDDEDEEGEEDGEESSLPGYAVQRARAKPSLPEPPAPAVAGSSRMGETSSSVGITDPKGLKGSEPTGLPPRPLDGSGSRSVEGVGPHPAAAVSSGRHEEEAGAARGRGGAPGSDLRATTSQGRAKRTSSSSSRARREAGGAANPTVEGSIMMSRMAAPSTSETFDGNVTWKKFIWKPGHPVEPLRVAWETLLEAAAKCVDEESQPEMRQRVSELMGWCVEAGISVKYGRKVRKSRLGRIAIVANSVQSQCTYIKPSS